MPEDELSKEIFICQHCEKEFKATQGAWPAFSGNQYAHVVFDGGNLTADIEFFNQGDTFYCYDCIDIVFPNYEFHDESFPTFERKKIKQNEQH